MEFDRESQIMTAGAAVTGAALAYIGGGDKVGVLGFGLAGTSLGAGLALALSKPGMGPFGSTKERIERCFAHAQMRLEQMAEEADSDLQERGLSLDEAVEYSTVALLAYWTWSIPVGATVLQSLGLTGLTTALWIKARRTLITNPVQYRRAPRSYLEAEGYLERSDPPKSKRHAQSSKTRPPTPQPQPSVTLEEMVPKEREIRSSAYGIERRWLEHTCFMNAALQFILHTPILGLLLDKDVHQPHPSTEQQAFFAGFPNFLRTYQEQNGIIPNPRWAIEAFGYGCYTQHDSPEALGAITDFVKTDCFSWETRIERTLDTANAQPSQEHSLVALTDEKCIGADEKPWLLLLTGAEDDSPVTLQQIFDRWQSYRPVATRSWIAYKDQQEVKQAPMIQQEVTVKSSNDHLFCLVDRSNGPEKLQFPIIDTTTQVKVAGQDYDLQAFVVHEGSANEGHYWTVARVNDQWTKFNDDKVEPLGLPGVLKELEKATYAYFSKA